MSNEDQKKRAVEKTAERLIKSGDRKALEKLGVKSAEDAHRYVAERARRADRGE